MTLQEVATPGVSVVEPWSTIVDLMALSLDVDVYIERARDRIAAAALSAVLWSNWRLVGL